MLALIAAGIFIGGALLALRLMPGPAFTLGALGSSIVILVVRHRTNGPWLVSRLPIPRSIDPLVLFGIIAGTAGLIIAFHAAWVTDIADVNAILRAIS
jgi:hypothetical protein